MSPADWSIIVGVLVIAAIDVLFIFYKTPTISNRFRAIGRQLSLFPYMWGVLGGHFWGPDLEPPFNNWWASIGLLLAIGSVLSGVHWIIRRWTVPPEWLVLLYLPCGTVAGIFLWPQ